MINVFDFLQVMMQKEGGTLDISNIKPICRCNLSMMIIILLEWTKLSKPKRKKRIFKLFLNLILIFTF